MTSASSAKSDRPSNWGRWGEKDERGAANFASGEVTAAAAGLVRTGRVVSMADEVRRDGVPVAPARTPATHLMSLDGGDFAAGFAMRDSDHGVADDYVFMACQGTTHVDALCHLWYDQQLYNGYSANRVRSYGATRLGIENMVHLATRGVFLDVARARGVDHLGDTDVIGADELRDLCAAQGVSVREGDCVVIRTGWRRVHDTDPARYHASSPGIDLSAAQWLAESHVSAVASDNVAVEVMTSEHTFNNGDPAPECHKLLIRDCGVYLFELLNLEELAEAQPSEFFFVAAPLRITGGAGSPVNPLAIL